MKLLKDWRFIFLVFLLLLSAYLLLPNIIFKQTKVVVAYLDRDAKCVNVKEGSQITQISGNEIKNLEDFDKALANIKRGDFASLVVDGEPANCIAKDDKNLGFNVKIVERDSNLKFGIDIEGGTRFLLKPKTMATKEEMQETIATLETRINLYGLREIRIAHLGENLIQIEMAGASSEEIKDFLAKQGKFEGKILESIKLSDGVGNIVLGDNSYKVKYVDGILEVNDGKYKINESFYIEDVKFEFVNKSDDSIVLLANVFTGKDITAVFIDPQHSYVRFVNNGYEFAFAVQISKESAERFAKITKNLPSTFIGNERYLTSPLILFLDGEPVSQLNIAADLAGKTVSTPSIQGFRQTREEALQEKLRLQSILRSGSLPIELEIVKVDTITQTAGKELINSIIFVAIAAATSVSAVIFIRYRDFKVSIPMILISFSEIVIILGFAALTNVLSNGKGWVLDIPAIAGLIAIIGTGVNQLIILTDQLLLEKEISLKQRHKTAISIILNSAYTVIMAMVPLIFLGVGVLRGFAITTIIGVLIGIIITRPAYLSILETIKKLE
ncbi:MAG: hypothetical protein QXQ18_02850 [Candidatus Aenigmatarchaeota archaeon]